MKRTSQQYVEQAAGHAAGVRLTARHAAGGDTSGHAVSAYPAHAGSAYPAPSAYAVGGKENAYRAAPGSKAAPLQSPRYGSNLAPPRSPRYTSSLATLTRTRTLTLTLPLPLPLPLPLTLTLTLTRYTSSLGTPNPNPTPSVIRTLTLA